MKHGYRNSAGTVGWGRQHPPRPNVQVAAGIGVGFRAGLGLGRGRGFRGVTELWVPHVAWVKWELPRDTVTVDGVDRAPLV